MKTTLKIWIALCVTVCISSCKNDDDATSKPPEEAVSIIGNWRLVSGNFAIANARFLSIDDDNSLTVLAEDEMGFRDEARANFTLSDTQLTVDFAFSGISINNYTVTEDRLTLVTSSGDSTVFTKEVSPLDSEGWIQDIRVLESGDAPWEAQVDIAFNGTHILIGNGYATNNIGFINPITFALDSELPTTESAFAIEVEKYDGPDRYIFQSNNGSRTYTAFFEDTGGIGFTSMDIGPWIYGIASVNSQQVWVSSNNDDTLYLHDYGTAFPTQTIEQTIVLNREVAGLDYQDGFLYVCSRGRVYKCQTTPNFEVVESISIEGHRVHGIAFDGTNFWFNAYSTDGSPNKILKSSLTL